MAVDNALNVEKTHLLSLTVLAVISTNACLLLNLFIITTFPRCHDQVVLCLRSDHLRAKIESLSDVLDGINVNTLSIYAPLTMAIQHAFTKGLSGMPMGNTQ